MLNDRIASTRTKNPWAPHSPDLNPLDFFLWGYAKDNVFKDCPSSLQELKMLYPLLWMQSPKMCERVMNNFAVRLNACLNENEAHIKHIIQTTWCKMAILCKNDNFKV